MKFEFIKHSDCSKNELEKIAFIKSQHWNYPLQSQLDWMENNLNADDTHLILYEDNLEPAAYLYLKNTFIMYNGIVEKVIGIGNVCTNLKNKGQGLGYSIMKLGEAFTLQNKLNGILLCKDTVKLFYIKCGWQQYNGDDLLYNAAPLKNVKLFMLKRIQTKQITIKELF